MGDHVGGPVYPEDVPPEVHRAMNKIISLTPSEVAYLRIYKEELMDYL